jgi:hypothetical protein
VSSSSEQPSSVTRRSIQSQRAQDVAAGYWVPSYLEEGIDELLDNEQLDPGELVPIQRVARAGGWSLVPHLDLPAGLSFPFICARERVINYGAAGAREIIREAIANALVRGLLLRRRRGDLRSDPRIAKVGAARLLIPNSHLLISA